MSKDETVIKKAYLQDFGMMVFTLELRCLCLGKYPKKLMAQTQGTELKNLTVVMHSFLKSLWPPESLNRSTELGSVTKF